MRLGLDWLQIRDRSDLEAALPVIDDLGIGTVAPPRDIADWSIEECVEYGDLVREFGLTVGEVGLSINLLVRDEDERARRIDRVRETLRSADAMGADTVFTLVGSYDDTSFLAPHPDNWGPSAREDVRENCRRILDGLELDETAYALEPWHSSFFHEPEPVSEFLDSVDDLGVKLHMDAINMHSPETYYRSTEIVDRAFDLLADKTVSVHAKDLRWDPEFMFLRIDEVKPGEGVVDWETHIDRLDDLPDDVPVFVEHWETDEEHEAAIESLRDIAARNDIELRTRTG